MKTCCDCGLDEEHCVCQIESVWVCQECYYTIKTNDSNVECPQCLVKNKMDLEISKNDF